MRIAFIGQQEEGGKLGTYADQVAKKMAQKGHEVFVYVRGLSRTPNIAEGAGVKMINFPGSGKDKKSFSGLEISPLLHVLFKKYDVVHFGASMPNITVWLLNMLKRNTVFVKTFQEDHLQSLKYPHAIIVTSEEALDSIWDKYRNKAILIHLLPEIKKKDEKYNLAQWGIREKRFALFCGRINQQSNIDLLIEAFKKLEDTCKLPNNFKLVIAGEFREAADLEYLEKIRDISRGRDNIILIKSRAKKLQAKLMLEAYAYISPQTEGALASTFIAAMAAELPIIANREEANREILGDAALYFSNKEEGGLSEKMAFLINRSDEARRLGEIGKKRAQKEYGWDTVAEKTLEVYENVINKIDKERNGKRN